MRDNKASQCLLLYQDGFIGVFYFLKNAFGFLLPAYISSNYLLKTSHCFNKRADIKGCPFSTILGNL